MKIEVYDTTLRDGTQGEGINLSLSDKLRIAERLDALGVDYIEGGWPGSNPKDVAFFRAAANRTWRHARIYAFGSTRRPNVRPEDDANLQALVESGTHGVTIFGKSWTHHVTEVLQTTYEENLAMIAESVAYLRSQGPAGDLRRRALLRRLPRRSDYALATLRAAAEAGAAMLVLCDTNGGSLPEYGRREATRAVRERFELPLGIHTHNDCELAVANSLAGIAAGASQVQGTFNGYGERCGNANLCSIIPTLELKLGHSCLPPGGLAHITETARFVGEVANRALETGQPYVGPQRLRAQGRHPRQRDAPLADRLPAYRPDAGGQPPAHPDLRAVRPRQRAGAGGARGQRRAGPGTGQRGGRAGEGAWRTRASPSRAPRRRCICWCAAPIPATQPRSRWSTSRW